MNASIASSVRSRKQHSGFTLVEIMIALVIIAGLVAGYLSTQGGTAARGKAVGDLQTLTTIQGNVDRFVNELGYVPSTWYTGGATPDGKTMTVAQIQAMMTHLMGLSPSSGGTAEDTYAQTNPVMNQNKQPVDFTTRLTAIVTSAGTGSTSGTRVIILQYRDAASGLIVNADKSTSTAFIPAATAMTAPAYFDAATNTAWTTAGKAAWGWKS